MGKVDENKKQKKERLMSTAFKLFTTQGMNKTSISDIASTAGVAKGTFYLYFKDKTDIQSALIARKANALFRNAFERIPLEMTSSEDRLIFVIDDILNQMQGDLMLVRFINKNLSWGLFQRALDRYAEEDDLDYMENVYRLLEDKEGQWDRPDIMLSTIVELLGSTSYHVILEHNPCDLATYKPYLYRHMRAIMECHRKVEHPTLQK